ncbi:hypothetical protein [Clavibacter phage 33]|nr:hypothetical protein [Clavibacter phage 33]
MEDLGNGPRRNAREDAEARRKVQGVSRDLHHRRRRLSGRAVRSHQGCRPWRVEARHEPGRHPGPPLGRHHGLCVRHVPHAAHVRVARDDGSAEAPGRKVRAGDRRTLDRLIRAAIWSSRRSDIALPAGPAHSENRNQQNHAIDALPDASRATPERPRLSNGAFLFSGLDELGLARVGLDGKRKPRVFSPGFPVAG